MTSKRRRLSGRELEAKQAWEAYVESGKCPVDVPARPDLVYKKEWKGWVDFLGWTPQRFFAIAKKDKRRRVTNDERHIDDILPDKTVTIGSNDDGSFIAADGMMWFPAKRKNWYFPVGKVKGWRP